MYNVMIVDDEQEIRQGIRLKVDWEALGLRIAGEASNGKEALELLEQEPCDIVITDMNMPVMDGLSFLEACRRLDPGICLIVVTGYEDFQYAHAAVRHQARHYLLKPVARDELTDALVKVKTELDKEVEDARRAKDMEWQLSRYYKELRDGFLLQLARGGAEEPGGRLERAKRFGLEAWNEGAVWFVSAGLLERSEGEESRPARQFRLPFELLCRELAERREDAVLIFRDEHYPGLIHAIVRGDKGQAHAYMDELRGAVRSHLGFEPTIGIGEAVTGFAQWREGYSTALLSWHLSEGNGRQTDRPSEEPAFLPEEKVQLLHRVLKKGELETFGRLVMESLVEAQQYSRTMLVKTIFRFHLAIESFAEQAGAPFDGKDSLWLRPDVALQLRTPELAADHLRKLAGSVVDRLGERGEDAEISVIEASRAYIDENYMYELNLTSLAEKFNYNPSYFSELFKAKTGKTFIGYVSDVRMGHAAKLLTETSLGLWDISELTGFSNPSYFSSRFKRMYGLSPSEYRQRPSEKNDSELPKK
ncbi:DNA-binding response regulator [Paenibacillus sp. MY03]|uniref:response regulator n=1 Tax=Paenibacillus sp. MY03 TaxID=302980 RepID=UPI000B3C5BD8|nr:response regulator [Paenibacillus sp. MY03]OUS77844.1 DNA-binding response regulator [Paenibacillus sp. MY03]